MGKKGKFGLFEKARSLGILVLAEQADLEPFSPYNSMLQKQLLWAK